MRKQERQIIIIEFEQFLQKNNHIFNKEVVFSKIFKTKRKFRADYYLPKEKIIIEINGGQWVNGRHNRGGRGYENDLTKMNLAQRNDVKYYQFTYEMIKKLEYIKIWK